jgi:hypothetical protein
MSTASHGQDGRQRIEHKDTDGGEIRKEEIEGHASRITDENAPVFVRQSKLVEVDRVARAGRSPEN